ncbi:hypothetical protein GUJ93_ZPchr0013g33898 [Zizania palustris]|uniref:Uncharacterized protein n=1 Tax=Zizania palustris TaxID=103762 RepID=A0A8J5X1X0_ZIZPA|nr:hypothetical protein GUJ93_ZPchr0013g33898 [Zizania palustris]
MDTTPPSPDSTPVSPFRRRRQRRPVFDRRYGWIFDEWTDPTDAALSGGRGMFCVLPMAQSLVDVAMSSVNYAADSVSRALKRYENFSPLAYLPPLSLQRKRHTWFRELEHVGVIAGAQLIPCRTQCTLECISTSCY